MGHNYVGTEHLLLGLLKIEESIAARTLRDLGIGYDEARTGVVNWISTYLANNPDAAQRVAEALARAADAGLQLDVAGAEAALADDETPPPSN
jgi:ATP-dependent Clp protease ATP-binding subunit ClpA